MEVELTLLTIAPQINKMFPKEEYPLKGCLNMEVIPEDSQKRSDYLLLIQARLYGWSGSNADRAKRLELSTQTVTSLMNGHAEGISLNQLIAIAGCISQAITLISTFFGKSKSFLIPVFFRTVLTCLYASRPVPKCMGIF